MKENNNEIKIQLQEGYHWETNQYPKQNVKLQFDLAAYPPVKWYPIPSFCQSKAPPNPNQGHKQTDFLEAVRASLLQVLNSEETDRFIDNYDCFKSRRFYLLIILVFAKWRSNNRLKEFQIVLAEQRRARNIPDITTLPQNDNLGRSMRACQFYLQGYPDRAVDELYKGCKESSHLKALNFIKQLDQQIRYNMTPTPDMESEDNSRTIEKLKAKMEENYSGQSEQKMQFYNQKKNIMKGNTRRIDDKQQNNCQNPFFIYQQNDPERKSLFFYDRSFRLRKSFKDLLYN